MKKLSPKASSTPKYQRIRGRGPIHDFDSPIQSPIQPEDHFSKSSEEESDTDERYYDRNHGDPVRNVSSVNEIRQRNPSIQQKNYESTNVNKKPSTSSNVTFTKQVNSFIAILLLLISGLFWKYFTTAQSENVHSFLNLSQKYPHQQEDLWYALTSGVDDVVMYNAPSVFLFLYKKESRKTVDHLLNDISLYTECKLNDCDTKPIIITSEMYKDKTFLSDYGHFIEKYKEPLLERSVMIIKNLELMPGQLAQALHSLCDRFNPLVHKSLFIFTMEVTDLNEEPVKNARTILRNSWANIKDDIFEPLFTRITSIVENINKEQK